MLSRRCERQAFTLVELLVVIAIIGVLVALLLPAVQAAREASRRMQCSNNLKQIALALHNYHDVHKTFPPAYIPDADGKPMHSWRVLILPYIEQQPLFTQYDFNEPWNGPNNSRLANISIPVYHCPSEPPGSTTAAYLAISGPGSIFDNEKGSYMGDIT